MTLSDKALSVFAFAAYHQLGSGQKVSRVIRSDGAGHEADPEAVRELEEAGLITVEGNDLVLGPDALARLDKAVEGLRGGASG